jgi:RNA polymerase sigma factor (sigma-70 family)
VQRVEIEEELGIDSGLEALNNVESALDGLEQIDPRLRAVVEMKIFEGCTGDEIAERLQCSPRSVASYWNFARNWLRKEWAGNRHR